MMLYLCKIRKNVFLNNQIYSYADLIFTHNTSLVKRSFKDITQIDEKILIVPHGNYLPFIKWGIMIRQKQEIF